MIDRLDYQLDLAVAKGLVSQEVSDRINNGTVTQSDIMKVSIDILNEPNLQTLWEFLMKLD